MLFKENRVRKNKKTEKTVRVESAAHWQQLSRDYKIFVHLL